MASQSAFVLAADLKAGDKLQTPDGLVTVDVVRNYHTTQVAYDLTIDGLHTYYVEAGDTPVPVHNTNELPCETALSAAKSEAENVADLTKSQRPNTIEALKIGDDDPFVAYSGGGVGDRVVHPVPHGRSNIILGG